MDRPTTKEVARFFDKVNITKHCWLWTATIGNKYGQFWFKGGIIRAHRFSYALFVGAIEPGKHILHRRECDNPSCVNPLHLYMGTHQDNMRDRDERTKRWNWNVRGEKHGRAKLTEPQVIEIKKNNIDSDIFLASQYGVTRSAIYHIRKGYNWEHV